MWTNGVTLTMALDHTTTFTKEITSNSIISYD